MDRRAALHKVVADVETFARNGIRVNGHLPFQDDLARYLEALSPEERLYVRAEMSRRLLQSTRVLSILGGFDEIDNLLP